MKKTLVAQALCAIFASMSLQQMAHADDAALLQRIDKLAAELEALKAELAATRKKTELVEQKQEVIASGLQTNAPANTVASTPMNSAASSTTLTPPSAPAQTIVTSYGEVNYTSPRNASNQAQADVARAVIGITHRFDEKTKMVAEFEWEHAVTSASDQGESEVEQLYVEHELQPGLAVKAGLFLIPIGLLNTSHEPIAYYGVHRNFVETAIIPTTWREVGVGVSGNNDNGIAWDAGITTGFDLTKWNGNSSEGLESPLGSIHQEGQLAKSKNLNFHAAVNWRGQPGLLLGGAFFTGKAGQSTANFTANDAQITVIDLHARYNIEKWDLSALYARGTISHLNTLNTTLVGQIAPVPSLFAGWYTQAAYALWKSESYSFTPFIRYEQFNTAKSYTWVPQGLGAIAGPDEKVMTFGASFKIGEGVVIKADYQKFNVDPTRDRYNLGVGYSF